MAGAATAKELMFMSRSIISNIDGEMASSQRKCSTRKPVTRIENSEQEEHERKRDGTMW
jgi:hypothetical protein